MYIESIEIKNIRAIDSLKMRFEKPAGWHVVIGDNGTGKSSVVRAIALALIGPEKSLALRLSWGDWLSAQQKTGSIKLQIVANADWDRTVDTKKASVKTSTIPVPLVLEFSRERVGGFSNDFSDDFAKPHSIVALTSNINAKTRPPRKEIWSDYAGWFSAAYGPFRRFTGGNPEWNKVFYSSPKVGAHLSAFGEDVALTEALEWLRELDYQRLKQQEATDESSEAGRTLEYLKQFINESGLLPHDAKLDRIEAEGPVFLDGHGNRVLVTQMSDGYRSILSLTFELIRQLVRVYSSDAVFWQMKKNKLEIALPGVVVIDEIDAHLHPTWQTRIGEWFLKHFPKIQFIVTTHSPLICRAAATGSIYRLAAPGAKHKSGEITGIERERLIYGNILDAYGTEVFGENISRSPESTEKMQELAALNLKSIMGEITLDEEEKLQELRQMLPTAGK